MIQRNGTNIDDSALTYGINSRKSRYIIVKVRNDADPNAGFITGRNNLVHKLSLMLFQGDNNLINPGLIQDLLQIFVGSQTFPQLWTFYLADVAVNRIAQIRVVLYGLDILSGMLSISHQNNMLLIVAFTPEIPQR